jgi:hypothetical protein
MVLGLSDNMRAAILAFTRNAEDAGSLAGGQMV